MASSSRMTAAMTCSCTSALSSVPASELCVKARRSPTKSWQIAALANLRPTICAPPDKRFFGTRATASRRLRLNESKRPRPWRGLFFAFGIRSGSEADDSLYGAHVRLVHHAKPLARTGVTDIAQGDAGRLVDEPGHAG